MDTPKLVKSDVRLCILARQAAKLKGGPGYEAGRGPED